MTAATLSALAASGPILANHLWQSTLVAAGAAMLAVALRRQQARVRYWIWLSASLKFIVPFSLLVAVGSHLGWRAATSMPPNHVAAAIDAIGEPFSFSRAETPVGMSSGERSTPSESGRPRAALTAVVVAVWCAGGVGVLFNRWRSWRRIASDLRRCRRLDSGRAYDTWSRLLRETRASRSVSLLSCGSTREPAAVGLFRPAVLWPERVSDLLDDAQLEAVLTHEWSHIRRRDNLAAAAHMTVEAAFWFHPAVWWLSARLVETREAACDEEVLARGAEPWRYADGLLQVCRYCLESPLPCAAGVTGSSLTRRIERIMTRDGEQPLSVGRRFLLSMAAVAVVIGPIAVGVMTPMPIRAQPSVPVPSATDVDSSTRSLSTAPITGPRRVPMSVPVRSAESVATRAQAPAATPSASQERGATKIEIHITVDGRDSAGFVPRDEPYTQGGPSVGLHVPPDSPARARDGRVISGFEFIGWTEGQRTRVLALALVPAAGEPNVYTRDAKRLQRVDLGSYLVGPELDVTVDAIPATGFASVVRLRAVRSRPDSAPAAAIVNAPVSPESIGQVFEIGHGVSAPVPVKTVDPEYPEEAKRARIQGEVELDGVVQTDGTLQDIRVTKSLDRMQRIYGLDQAAIDAAKKWLFQPGVKDGRPVPVVVSLILEFRLRDSPPTGAQQAATEFGSGAHKLNEPGLVPPKVTDRIDPTYTSAALRQKIAGTIKAEAVVLADGTIGDVRVVQSLDKTYGLDEAALSAVRRWRFDPGTLDDRPVAVIVTLTLEFRLH